MLHRKEVAVRKVAAHLCLTLVVKEVKMSGEQGRVVTTLNINKMNRLSFRNNRLKFKALGNLSIILEEYEEYTSN
jgi:hypothetical protein